MLWHLNVCVCLSFQIRIFILLPWEMLLINVGNQGNGVCFVFDLDKRACAHRRVRTREMEILAEYVLLLLIKIKLIKTYDEVLCFFSNYEQRKI